MCIVGEYINIIATPVAIIFRIRTHFWCVIVCTKHDKTNADLVKGQCSVFQRCYVNHLKENNEHVYRFVI